VEDEPIDIRISGLGKEERVTVAVRSTDAKGFVWSSRGVFVASSRGIVDVAHAPSIFGSYNGVWSMGLVAAMKPNKHDPNVGFSWNGSRPMTFTVKVEVGRSVVASTTFRRSWGDTPLSDKNEALATTGVVGTFVAPHGAVRRTALLVFGGSEGGLSTALLAQRFAADGYPTLALAYFREPGLRQTLTNIPLEYFQHALQWLSRQPQVDPKRMVVLGISRGSEAAQLLGVHYPDLVHGVIALVPSNVALCGIPGAGNGRCIGAAWTLNGKPIPYSTQVDTPHPTNKDAVIPDEQINGPLLAACGGDDATWNSCAYATAIIQRLNAKHTRFSHYLYAYPDAGHSLGACIPDEPGWMTYDVDVPGSEQARETLWPHILAFLRAITPR
jgi:dienelactone hydrolase